MVFEIHRYFKFITCTNIILKQVFHYNIKRNILIYNIYLIYSILYIVYIRNYYIVVV